MFCVAVWEILTKHTEIFSRISFYVVRGLCFAERNLIFNPAQLDQMASICVQSETNFQGSKIECFDLPDYEL